jgi:hypothetical protein
MSSTQDEPESTFFDTPLFSVDSTPAASRRSASGLASFSGDPRACAISWPGLLDLLKINVFHLDSTLAASRGSAFSLASFFEWTRRLRRLVARPSASLLLRMTPAPAESRGPCFFFRMDSTISNWSRHLQPPAHGTIHGAVPPLWLHGKLRPRPGRCYISTPFVLIRTGPYGHYCNSKVDRVIFSSS